MSADTNCTHKHLGVFDAGKNLKLSYKILTYLLIIIIPLLGICYKMDKHALCGGNISPSVLLTCPMNCFTDLAEIGYFALLCCFNMNLLTLLNIY
jgi:hypothetical protein